MAEGHQIRRDFIDTPFGQLHFRECGSGPPLILVHQALRSSLEFRRMLPILGRSRRAIAVDLMGFGDSALPTKPLRIEDHATALLAAIDALGLRALSIGGHHTGASVALEVAVCRPDAVDRLILSGPALVEDETERKRLFETLSAQPEPKPDASGTHLAVLWKEGLASAFGTPRLPASDLELLTEFLLEQLKAGPRRGEAHAAAFTYAIERRLPLVRSPVLLAYGTEDMWVCRRVDDVRRLLPPDTPIAVAEFSGAGEYPRIQPAAFAEEILRFLD